MGLGKAVVFGGIAALPGMFLSLLAWLVIGAPDEWSASLNLVCYGPFFGCIAVGIWLGSRSDASQVELE